MKANRSALSVKGDCTQIYATSHAAIDDNSSTMGGFSVTGSTDCQFRVSPALMALGGRYMADRAITMLVAVAAHECRDPVPRGLQISESPLGPPIR